jgi:hypothetical protein
MLLDIEREHGCDSWLWRPLHYAALHGIIKAIEALVTQVDANVDARTGGYTPTGRNMSKATFNFSAKLEFSRVHVKAEEVNGEDVVIREPLSTSTRTVPIKSIRCAGYSSIQHSSHTRHFSNATPLHIAVEYRHIESIQALLELRADPNTSWNEGKDIPLHTAITQSSSDAVRALLEYHADPNHMDSFGSAPLMTAAVKCKNPSRVVAVMLLEAGAARGAVDRQGKTAAQLARELGHREFADAVESYRVMGDVVRRPSQAAGGGATSLGVSAQSEAIAQEHRGGGQSSSSQVGGTTTPVHAIGDGSPRELADSNDGATPADGRWGFASGDSMAPPVWPQAQEERSPARLPPPESLPPLKHAGRREGQSPPVTVQG